MQESTKKILKERYKKVQQELGRHYYGQCNCFNIARCRQFVRRYTKILRELNEKIRGDEDMIKIIKERENLIKKLKYKPINLTARKMSGSSYIRLPKEYSVLIPVDSKITLIPQDIDRLLLKIDEIKVKR